MGFPAPRPSAKFTWAMMMILPAVCVVNRAVSNEPPGLARQKMVELGGVLDIALDSLSPCPNFTLEYAFVRGDLIGKIAKEPGGEHHTDGRAAVLSFPDVLTGSRESGEIVRSMRAALPTGITVFQLPRSPGAGSGPCRIRIVTAHVELQPGDEAVVAPEPVGGPEETGPSRPWDGDLELEFTELTRDYLFGEPNADMLMEQFFRSYGRGNAINILDAFKEEVLEWHRRRAAIVMFPEAATTEDAKLEPNEDRMELPFQSDTQAETPADDVQAEATVENTCGEPAKPAEKLKLSKAAEKAIRKA